MHLQRVVVNWKVACTMLKNKCVENALYNHYKL
jgi:hypothetical protein